VEPLTLIREKQQATIARYMRTQLSDVLADHALMRFFREGVINLQRIGDVEREWQEPSFEEFQEERNVFRLFNAVTYALEGRILERRDATPKLHQILDQVCELVH
jgi:hypothetical protein